MMKRTTLVSTIISYFFILLFGYAAFSKLLEFETFQVQLAQSPLLSAYAGIVSYAVITIEIIAIALLSFNFTRLAGLYLSLALMSGFTIYIFLILNFSDFIPCSCGGILEKLGWTEHLIFNVVCIALAVTAILVISKANSKRLQKPILISAIVAFISCIGVIILFLTSEHIIKKENNFTRRFLLHPVVKDTSFDIGLNSYYFAGVDDENIYLGNITAPLLFTKIDTALRKTSSIKITLDHKDFKFRNLQLLVKTPYYYLYDGSIPIIYRSIINDSIARILSFRDAYFTTMNIVDSAKFVIRTQRSTNKQYTLALLNLNGHPKIHLNPEILEKQIDGVFDVSGKLITNQTSGTFIYTYTYRNQFIVLDTALNILNKLNTIDTIKTAQIVIKKLSDGSHKMAAPPLKVNVTSTANHTLLFNQSNMMGKNESRNAWAKASVVDIYRIDQKEYIGSFYIYHRKGEAMSQMLLTDQYLYVLIGTELIRYNLRKPITKYFKAGEAENLNKE